MGLGKMRLTAMRASLALALLLASLREATATYFLIVSGSCTSSGLYTVKTASDCNAAARELGLSDTTASDDAQSGGVSYDPP